MNIIVYKITCLINNKVYIGASKDPNLRLKEHLRGNGNEDIYNDMLRFNKNVFVLELLSEPLTVQEASVVELFYIDQHASHSYNRIRLGYHHTEYSMKLLSDRGLGHKRLLGHKPSLEARENMSKAKKGIYPSHIRFKNEKKENNLRL